MIKNPPVIERIVKEMGGKIVKIVPERGYFYIDIKGKRLLVTRKFQIAGSLTADSALTRFKDLTDFILKENGIATPKTASFYRKTFNEKEAKRILKAFEFPVIIKDAAGSNSKGIFPMVKNSAAAIRTLKQEFKNFSCLIVQNMIQGKEYRVTVLDKKVIGALEMIPPRVWGNGRDNISKLIVAKQRDMKKKTPIDNALRAVLREQGFRLKDIPQKNQAVFIRKNSSLAEGGELRDVTALVNPEIKKICVRATKLVERTLSGIDVMCDDITKDPRKQSFNVIEINGKPDIYIHYNPNFGKTRDVVRDIINYILKTQ
ncbi:ATP-grasp domain-containing protein [Patescibacteria group bacterium]|nr:MAG: ATP-grasp domain-containing protein [Patescibacteria group bacterium]